MTQIKKVKTSEGVQFYPQTHTKAVIDDNGYTAESRLGAMQDEINQAQLAVGAVPSDLTPIDGSSNWVTSGGVYNELNVGDANVEIDLTQYETVRAFTGNTWVVTDNNYPYYGKFIPIFPLKKYAILSNNSSAYKCYAFLKNNTYSQNATIAYATGCSRVTMQPNTRYIDTAPSDARYLYIATITKEDVTPQSVVEINKKSLATIIEATETTPTENSGNLVTSGGVYNALPKITNMLFENTATTAWQSGNISNGSIVTNYANRYLVIELPEDIGVVNVESSASTFTLVVEASNSASSGYIWKATRNANSSLSTSINLSGYSYLCLVLWDRPTTAQAQQEVIKITYKTLLENLDDINEDIDFVIDKIYYEDRLPTVGKTNNKYVYVSNDAAVYDTISNFYYTGFIYVGDCSSIKIPGCYQWGCVFFDANKQYNGNYKRTSTDVNTPVTVDIPENTSYVQVNIKTSGAQYVYCYLSETKRELSPNLKIKTSQIIDRNGQNLILPLDKIVTEPSGGQTSLSENRFTRTGATTNGYLTAAKSGDVWTTTWHSSGQHGCTDYIDIHDAIKLTIGCDVTANFVYFDENKVCCGNFVGNGSLTAKTTTPPAGAYYARMNYDTRYIASSSLIVYFNVNTYNLNPIVAISPDSITALKPLSGLKVAWYGTSIPHGYPYQNTAQDTYSYANRAVTELGGIIQNRCVSGGFIISATNTADTHNQTSRFTDIDPEGTYYSAVNYKTRIVDLIGTADEPDIFVFDWGANDGQFYQSYFNGINLDTVDITTEDIKTFIGAYNTIIKALLTAKPKARIFLVTHYSDDGQSNEMTRKDGYRTMNRLIEKIADYWHIPCNSVYKKTGWIYNRNGISNIRSQWCKDGIHPANSANVESIKFLTKIHKQFLMENYCY